MSRKPAYCLVMVRCYLAAHQGDSYDAMARDLVQIYPPMSYDTARRYLRKARDLPAVALDAAVPFLALARHPLAAPDADSRAPAPQVVDVEPLADQQRGLGAKVASRRATLQNYLQRNPTATVKQVAHQFGVSWSTAANDIAAYVMPSPVIRHRRVK